MNLQEIKKKYPIPRSGNKKSMDYMVDKRKRACGREIRKLLTDIDEIEEELKICQKRFRQSCY